MGDPASSCLARQTIELAFVAALQVLPPRQTAVLLLGDVLGYAAAEVAEMLDASPTAVKGLLQRARATMARSTAPSVGSVAAEQEIRLAQRFAEAFSADDVEGVVSLLTDEAWLAMPPATQEYRGRPAIVCFLRASAAWRGERHLLLAATRANTQPAFGCYLPSEGGARAAGSLVLTMVPDGIAGITRFLSPHLHRHFRLPDRLP